MTEPPAAPALELLAIETGPLSVVPLVVVIVVSPYVGSSPEKPQSGDLAVPALP
jgi:hypothetical protein